MVCILIDFRKQIQYKLLHKQNLCVTNAKYAEVWVWSIPRITQLCILVSHSDVCLYLIECESHNQKCLTTNTIQNIRYSERDVEKTTKKKEWEKNDETPLTFVYCTNNLFENNTFVGRYTHTHSIFSNRSSIGLALCKQREDIHDTTTTVVWRLTNCQLSSKVLVISTQ